MKLAATFLRPPRARLRLPATSPALRRPHRAQRRARPIPRARRERSVRWRRISSNSLHGSASDHGDRNESMSKAMVIDDSRAIRLILTRTLAEFGYEVCQAANGREAIQALEQEAGVSLILVDWNMPEMNGL